MGLELHFQYFILQKHLYLRDANPKRIVHIIVQAWQVDLLSSVSPL